MMNNVMDVETYVPQDGDKYFFDANIWLYFYCPIGSYKKVIISKYDSFLKRALSNNTTIYVSSLLASEIINAWLRLDFNRLVDKRIFKDRSKMVYKKCYRGSKYYLIDL